MEVRARAAGVWLKSLEPGDAAELARNADNEEIARSVGRPGEFPHPYTEEAALFFIDDARRKLRERSAFHFGIRLGSGFIGACGVYSIDRIRMSGEIGYWLSRERWGEGRAKEALGLLLGFCFCGLRLNKVSATVLVSNERSIGLLRSLNFAMARSLPHGDAPGAAASDSLTFSMLRQAYPCGDNSVEITGDGAPTAENAPDDRLIIL
jgi:ribosomal-protein-alanine N-acetyltransferase